MCLYMKLELLQFCQSHLSNFESLFVFKIFPIWRHLEESGMDFREIKMWAVLQFLEFMVIFCDFLPCIF